MRSQGIRQLLDWILPKLFVPERILPNGFHLGNKHDYLIDDETQPILMDMSIIMEHSYCRRSTSWALNNYYSSTTKNMMSSPLQSYVPSPFDNLLSPICPSTNVKVLNTFYKVTTSSCCSEKEICCSVFFDLGLK